MVKEITPEKDEPYAFYFPSGGCRLKDEELICDHPIILRLGIELDCEKEGHTTVCYIKNPDTIK